MHEMKTQGLSSYTALRILNDEFKMIQRKYCIRKSLFYFMILSLKNGILRYFAQVNIVLLLLVFVEFIYNTILVIFDIWTIAIVFNTFFVTFLNLYLISIDTRAKYTSLFNKISKLIDDIQNVMDNDCEGWIDPSNYPFIRIPFANSVNLQWTYRDGQLINLPVALLVKNDKVLLRPGQYIFVETEIDSEDLTRSEILYKSVYKAGETFLAENSPSNKSEHDHNHEHHHDVRQCVLATVNESAALKQLDRYLYNQEIIKSQGYQVTIPERYIEYSLSGLIIFMFVLVIILMICQIVLGRMVRPNWPKSCLSHLLLIGLPIQLPLLLAISLANSNWTVKDVLRKLERRYDIQMAANADSNKLGDGHGISVESIPSSDSNSDSTKSRATSGPLEVSNQPMVGSRLDCLKEHWSNLIGPDQQMGTLLFTLGNLTSLCCVDKKGILSDPIATPEKLFFYRRRHRNRSNSLVNVGLASTLANKKLAIEDSTNQHAETITIGAEIVPIEPGANDPSGLRFRSMTQGSTPGHSVISMPQSSCAIPIPIILDISRSSSNPFQLTFDDSKWQRYMTSLKPIGLNILLNNCNPDAADKFRQFSDTISALYHDAQFHKSVLSHRCICSLANQIGFKSAQATQPFSLVKTFSLCRRNLPYIEHKSVLNTAVGGGGGGDCDRPSSQLSSVHSSAGVSTVFMTIVKQSYENSASVPIKSSLVPSSYSSPNSKLKSLQPSSRLQLMSHGSADLLLELCDNYWDGRDICPLTDTDRARLLEFYNRNIFHSYCIAFGYSPLIDQPQVLTLPNQIKRLSIAKELAVLSPSLSPNDILSLLSEDLIVQLPSANPNNVLYSSKLDNFNSRNTLHNESLRRRSSFNTISPVAENKPLSKPKLTEMSNPESQHLSQEDYNKYLSTIVRPQIFLGMLALQADQVEADVIDCINKLEQACIRFVFFSPDNQLRSRVFAERLGLESGWNCHISLAPDQEVPRKDSVHTHKEANEEENKNKPNLQKNISLSEPTLIFRKNRPPTSPVRNIDHMVHSTTFTVTGSPTQIPIFKLETTQASQSSSRMTPIGPIGDHHYTVTSVPPHTHTTTSMTHHHSGCSISNSSSDEGCAAVNEMAASFSQDPHDHFPDYKSKLPTGIKSIRPHLEQVDNVPLLVSLFTDCTSEVNQEMMQIMREYGEIICCVGSSLGIKNISVFGSNDCAVAFIPNLHRSCLRERANHNSNTNNQSQTTQLPIRQTSNQEAESLLQPQNSPINNKQTRITPIDIASKIVSLPCGLLLHRKHGFNLIPFITESHRLVNNILAMLAFYSLACASSAILFLIGQIAPITFVRSKWINHVFNETHVLYHLYYHLPLLSLLVYSRRDLVGKPLKKPSRKRLKVLTTKQCIRFVLVSAARFLPAVILTLTTGLWSVSDIVKLQTKIQNTTASPTNIDQSPFNINNSNFLNQSNFNNSNLINESELRAQIVIGQLKNMTKPGSDEDEIWTGIIGDFMFVQFNYYMVIVSFFYLTLEKQFWKFNCHKNLVWSVCTVIVCLVLLTYSCAKIVFNQSPSVYINVLFVVLHKQLILATIGCFLVFFIGVVANIWEMRSLAVEYRLWRLFFNTKLGMYSPV